MDSPILTSDRYFLTLLLLFLLLSPASSVETRTRPDTNPPDGYRFLNVRNARPLFLNRFRRLDGFGERRMERVMIKRKKITAGDPRPFTVMLPKGFVPPSGSSPCHNENPNSAVTLYCDFSASKP